MLGRRFWPCVSAKPMCATLSSRSGGIVRMSGTGERTLETTRQPGVRPPPRSCALSSSAGRSGMSELIDAADSRDRAAETRDRAAEARDAAAAVRAEQRRRGERLEGRRLDRPPGRPVMGFRVITDAEGSSETYSDDEKYAVGAANEGTHLWCANNRWVAARSLTPGPVAVPLRHVTEVGPVACGRIPVRTRPHPVNASLRPIHGRRAAPSPS